MLILGSLRMATSWATSGPADAAAAVAALEMSRWLVPAGLAAAGLALAVLSETWVMARLRRAAQRTEWGWDNAVLAALRGMTFVWFAAAGVYGAKEALALSPTLGAAVDKVLVVAVGLSLTVVGARVAVSAIRMWSRSTEGPVPSISLLENVARILVYVLGAFLILQNLGIKVSALVASLGIGGLAVALALQDTLSNLFAGFQIILAGQVRTGDYIRLDTGEEGYVTDIRWRNTTIMSRVEDHEVVIPNGKLANAIVTNFDLPEKALWVRLGVGVSYDSDLEEVERVTLEVAREVLDELGLADAFDEEPVLRYKAFGDSSISFSLRVRIGAYADQFRVQHLLVKRIHARYREEGIEIPFPIRTVYAPRGVTVRRAGEGPEGGTP